MSDLYCQQGAALAAFTSVLSSLVSVIEGTCSENGVRDGEERWRVCYGVECYYDRYGMMNRKDACKCSGRSWQFPAPAPGVMACHSLSGASPVKCASPEVRGTCLAYSTSPVTFPVFSGFTRFLDPWLKATKVEGHILAVLCLMVEAFPNHFGLFHTVAVTSFGPRTDSAATQQVSHWGRTGACALLLTLLLDYLSGTDLMLSLTLPGGFRACTAFCSGVEFLTFLPAIVIDDHELYSLSQAGNVVTGEMVEELILSGADIIKVGQLLGTGKKHQKWISCPSSQEKICTNSFFDLCGNQNHACDLFEASSLAVFWKAIGLLFVGPSLPSESQACCS
ncbi:hypothetical protein P7K49_007274 [Saguinus oedipus]|uniref:Uncharacterized protein n=1 Tax=Saguinus oedipus TaxID=9490 RepID=A0ABQ9VUD2_SAGOE|nr:hypothetical protein P7K49_007274 [Saguinus oedipus]